MTEEKARELLQDLLKQIDYDLYKEIYVFGDDDEKYEFEEPLLMILDEYGVTM